MGLPERPLLSLLLRIGSSSFSDFCLDRLGEDFLWGGLYLAEPLLEVVLQLSALSESSSSPAAWMAGGWVLTRGSRLEILVRSEMALLGRMAFTPDL